MKFYKSVFVLVAALISVSAFAGTRKPSTAAQACGNKSRAIHYAIVVAGDDGHTNCKDTSAPTDGPEGSFFTTYHVVLSCSDGTFNYDSESHLVGLPGKLVCTPTVHEAGQFEAN